MTRTPYNHSFKSFFTLSILFGLLLTSSCSKQEADQTGPSVVTENPECSTSYSYSSSAHITGMATFSKRSLNVTLDMGIVTRMILSNSAVSTNLPIRYAEVKVTDGAGTTVQCGKTNSSGQLKALDGTSNLVIPATAGQYTVYVFSRSNTSLPVPGGKPSFNFYVSVKSDISTQNVYSISSTVTSPGSGAVPVLINATHSEAVSSDIEGGAFNIYNSILTSYDYLSTNTGTSDLSCLNPKLSVFWKAGFNPGQYVYPEDAPEDLDPFSFYLNGYSEMYISGGRLGSVTVQDTDHFDDAIIIHELGHRIEDVCGNTDSPGGEHNGQVRIDPRLAWSEGWGNFFGAHVIQTKITDINPDLTTGVIGPDGWLFYYDSDGYGSNGYEYIRINLTRAGNNSGELLYTRGGIGTLYYDQVDSTNRPGESHFREVSIARGLFKSTNTCTSTCANSNYFSEFWSAFENATSGIGLGKSTYAFRSSIRFFDRLKMVFGGTLPTDIRNILTVDESLHPIGDPAFTQTTTSTASSGQSVVHQNWIPYGVRLIANGSTPCPILISPRRTNILWETNDNSDQRFSNHFYWIDRNSIPSVSSIRMQGFYETGTSVDLDLIVFDENHRFLQDHQLNADLEVVSNNKVTPLYSPVYSRGATSDETVSISALSSSSNYLLNVRAYSNAPNMILGTTKYSYILTDQSGGYLCPANTF